MQQGKSPSRDKDGNLGMAQKTLAPLTGSFDHDRGTRMTLFIGSAKDRERGICVRGATRLMMD